MARKITVRKMGTSKKKSYTYHAIKTKRAKGAMLEGDAYDHGRPHVGSSRRAMKKPQGAEMP
jgi:hypothetical protein